MIRSPGADHIDKILSLLVDGKDPFSLTALPEKDQLNCFTKCRNGRWTFRVCGSGVLNYGLFIMLTDQVAGETLPPLECGCGILSRRESGILIEELSSAKHQRILPARTANSVLCPRRVIILLSAATRYGARLVRGHSASGQRSMIWCAVFQNLKRIGSNNHGRWQGARIRRMHICMHGRLYAPTGVLASIL